MLDRVMLFENGLLMRFICHKSFQGCDEQDSSQDSSKENENLVKALKLKYEEEMHEKGISFKPYTIQKRHLRFYKALKPPFLLNSK